MRVLPGGLRKFEEAHLMVGATASKANTAYERMDPTESIDGDCGVKTDHNQDGE
jgi:hypothetical protein